MSDTKQQAFDASDMPDKGPFERKEVNQFPPPQDTGEPLKKKNEDNTAGKTDAGKTSKREGLNEESSEGSANAYTEPGSGDS